MSVDVKEMTNEEKLTNIIWTPALGRPFRLGMLYDRYHDNIIPGETLLRMEDMEQHTFIQRRNGCFFDVRYGDSLQDKSIAFNGDLNLQLNALIGMVALGSSGKFLKNTILSKKQLRVALKAEYIMLYKELEMQHFQSDISKIKSSNATHIVTAIEYGTNVEFTFDRTLSDKEDVVEASGKLKDMISCIKIIEASADAQFTKESKNKQESEKLSCKFCGDIILPFNPTTYEEAAQLYKELPKYVKEEEAVPVNVWLYPIPTATKVLQTINKEKMKRTVAALDDMQRIIISCNDLMSGQAFAHIPGIQCKLDLFRKTVQTFQEDLQDQVFAELHEKEDLSKDKISPCLVVIDNMKHWLSQNAEIEISLLNIYINEIKKENIEILPKSGVDAKLFEHDHVIILDVVLPFSSGQYVKEELRTLSNCTTQQRQSSFTKMVSEIREHRRHDATTTSPSTNAEVKCWYEDAETKATVRKTIKRFLTLHKKFGDFEFFVTFTDRKDSELQNKKSSCVRLLSYEDGEIDESNNLMSSEAEENLYSRTDY